MSLQNDQLQLRFSVAFQNIPCHTFSLFYLKKATNSAIMNILRAEKFHFIPTISFFRKTHLYVLYNKVYGPDLKKKYDFRSKNKTSPKNYG